MKNDSMLPPPLVIGSPRSGFALLTSVLAHLLPMTDNRRTATARNASLVIDYFGDHIASRITGVFEAVGKQDDLIYNGNFRQLTGGPKWVDGDDPDRAKIRKYIGVRGLGDFTLVTAHPLCVMDHDGIVHSHNTPGLWPGHPHYRDRIKFASVRQPAGIISSALLSINALTSEYIQRFVPEQEDTHAIRERIGFYKFTDLDFFEGIVTFYRDYFDDYLQSREHYVEMHWEELIERPAETIQSLARALSIPVDTGHASDIWARLNHRNLTGAHKHNFRTGAGVPGDWRNWLTNRHLQILRDAGLSTVSEELGYGPIEDIPESSYTPFQRRVDDALKRGDVIHADVDPDLFGFAFNKSNLTSDKFPFDRFDWRAHTRIERSCFKDRELLRAVSDAADAATGEVNRVLDAVLANGAPEDVVAAAEPLHAEMPRAFDAFAEAYASGDADRTPPFLIHSVNETNIVRVRGKFLAIPQSLGNIDLAEPGVFERQDIFIGADFEAALNAAKQRRRKRSWRFWTR